MKNLKITLKKVKTFKGHEGVGLNCDVYINGTKCLEVIDNANGGEWYFYPEPNDKAQALIAEWDAYLKTLPPLEWKTPNGRNISIPMDREIFINNILEQEEKEKMKKRMNKLMSTSILFGVPDGDGYSYINYKQPLSSIPRKSLQIKVNKIMEKYCTENVIILNTNLKELGIII